MKLKIISDGLVRNTKVVNAETNELVEDVKEFIIHAKSSMGLVEVQIKFSRLAFEIVAEKKKRIKTHKFPSSTDYSISCISANEKTVMDGEGRVDLEYVKDNGVDPGDRISWYLWKYFIKTFSVSKLTKIKTSDVVDFIRRDFGTDQSGIEFKFDRTTANHCINKFHFIGLLSRQKKADECIYSFSKIVKRRGLDWFRKDNQYLKGHFQSDTQGLFNLQEVANES